MQGVHKGVVTQLKGLIMTERFKKQRLIMETRNPSIANYPRIFTEFHAMYGVLGVHCVCHRFALVLTECISKQLIPAEAVELLSKVYEYFCKSGMRKRNLKKFVKKVNDARAKKRTVDGGLVDIDDPDDALHRIIRLECDRIKLPKKVVLTRWLGCELCVNVIIGGRPAYALYFDWESQPKPSDTPSTDRSKAQWLRDKIQQNDLFVWFYFLADTIPILTRMNVLFQATLPLPHLLYEKVDGAKSQLRLMIGQEPRDDMIPEAELDKDTRFGPAVESFFLGCQRGNHKYGDRGGVLNGTKVLELKLKMFLCVHFMLENLDLRFPKEDLYVYKLLRVVDPRLRRRLKLGGMTHGECVKHLLHIFEVPLYGFVDAKKVLQSHTVFLASPAVADLVLQFFVLDDNGNHNESSIYEFYYELLKLGGDTYEWAKFSLFYLIIAIRNVGSHKQVK